MKDKKAITLSVFDFFKMFPDEAAATRFVEEQVWQGEVKCRFCESNKTSPRPHRHGHRCKSCGKDFTVRHGTIFENSRLPLIEWLYTIYLVQTSRKSISSLQLSKELGRTQKTAWFLLHRIREACKQGDWKLTNVVEIDETYIGGKEKNKHLNKRTKGTQGRSTLTKTAVIGARERNGRVKAKTLNKTDGATLKGFIYDNVELGSTVYTDEHRGYIGLGGIFYRHESVNHSAKEYVNGMAHTNSIESVWADW